MLKSEFTWFTPRFKPSHTCPYFSYQFFSHKNTFLQHLLQCYEKLKIRKVCQKHLAKCKHFACKWKVYFAIEVTRSQFPHLYVKLLNKKIQVSYARDSKNSL